MQGMLIFVLFGWVASCIFLGILGASREIGQPKALLISIFLSPLIGAIFVATSPIKQKRISFGANKFGEKLFEGDQNIESPSYQLYLTQTFNIEKNATLEKYTFDGNVFETLPDALEAADKLYSGALLNISKNFEAQASEDAARKQRGIYVLIGSIVGVAFACWILYRFA